MVGSAGKIMMMEDKSDDELHDLQPGDVIRGRDHRPGRHSDHNDDILTERKYFDENPADCRPWGQICQGVLDQITSHDTSSTHMSRSLSSHSN